MEIEASEVFGILKEKGVDHIHHANSVLTSCQFLRRGALLSRGTIERSGLYQTPQSSDGIDKEFGIWFDVFCDSVDIHERAKRANVYGPVLFKLDVKLVAEAYTGGVWVTKLNPTKWAGKEHGERWFTSASDLRTNFVRGQFDQMIVFRHCGGELPIRRPISGIILDDPDLKGTSMNIDGFSMAYGAIMLAMAEGRCDASISKRECHPDCTCRAEYKSDLKKTGTMFLPKLKS